MKDIENHINEWAENLPFDQLSEAQQASVLSVMTQNEYSNLHESNQAITLHLTKDIAGLVPDPTSLERLKGLEQGRDKKTRRIVLWLLPTPLYATAAACLLVFGLSYLVFKQDKVLSLPEKEIVQLRDVIHDTIYIDRVVEGKNGTSLQEPRISNTPKPSINRAISTQYVPEVNVYVQDITEAPDAELIAKSFGNSPVKLASLEQFKVNM
jgi:hypothetical protein